ncbi:D-alanyl-D-alanine carboxypeptidase [bacterium]|nr:D-alanyl-D-alanine carboxypeptidase [bacterium]
MKITSSSKYPMSVVNLLSFGQSKKFMVNRYDWTNPEVVELVGTIKGKTTITVPISSMRRYFIYVLNDLFSTYNIKIKNASYNSKLLPSNAKKIAEVTTPVSSVYTSILQNSDNKDAETLFKVATANKYSATATSELEARFFKEYWNGKRVPSNSISIADASGASRNNLVSVDWMTNALVNIYNNASLYQTLKYNMAQPGDGTLSSRLFDLRGEAWLKTGSLAGVSGITGFITDKKGKTYVVAILIQNFITEPKNVKTFEDEVIKVIYE